MVTWARAIVVVDMSLSDVVVHLFPKSFILVCCWNDADSQHNFKWHLKSCKSPSLQLWTNFMSLSQQCDGNLFVISLPKLIFRAIQQRRLNNFSRGAEECPAQITQLSARSMRLTRRMKGAEQKAWQTSQSEQERSYSQAPRSEPTGKGKQTKAILNHTQLLWYFYFLWPDLLIAFTNKCFLLFMLHVHEKLHPPSF